MEQNMPFIGVGTNPQGVDLPLGLGMLLAQDTAAIDSFGRLTVDEQTALVNYIQSGATGEDAQARIADAVERLRNNDMSLFR